jgi:hypothetical protein
VSPILNILRFILALCVVLYHFHGELAGDAGRVAVVGFFLISGFLITLIVNETYPTPAHNWNFLVNRFLRIYPQYVFAAVVGLLAVSLYPQSSRALNSVLKLPDTLGEIIPHFTIFGLYRTPRGSARRPGRSTPSSIITCSSACSPAVRAR